ncbi:MAG: LptA/OstA family protein [Sphingomonadaceae bacterium]
MISIARSALVPALLLALLPGAPALAQLPGTSALKGLDTQAPIDVDADRIEVLDRENQAIFTGSVRVTQARMTLEAGRIKVVYTRGDTENPVIRRLDADGNVRLTTPSERATGRFGIYDVEKRLITVIGNVVLIRGETRVEGDRLTIDLASGRSLLDGRGSATGEGGRVSGRFAVPDRK